MVATPSTNVVRGGILIGFVTNLGLGLGRISTRRNLNWSSGLAITIGVVGTPHMVFTNSIMITHVNKIAYQPLMNSMAIGRYINTNAKIPRRRY
jgi:hypothetical protein